MITNYYSDSMKRSINEISDFRRAEINGISALYTDTRIDRNSLPQDVFVYDMRCSDDGDEDFCTVEPIVTVNYSGTVVTKHEIPMNAEGYADIWEFAYDEEMSLEEFLAEEP